MAVPVTTLNRAQFSQFLPNEQAIRWAESLQAAASSFVSGGGGGSLTPSGVTAGNYGDNANVGAFTVDVNGIITAAANTPIAITFAQVSGVVPITQGGTGQTTAPNAINALLPTQSAGTVGWYLQSNGTVCSWQPAPGGGGGGTVTQVDGVAGEITGGPITVTGTLGLATTGVAAASYGSASSVAQVTFDTKGRATSASSVAIAITGAAVSGNIAGNAANVTGVVAVANGGSGATTLTGYLKGNGTSAFTAVSSVPATDISGTLLVANGGTGAATFTAGYLKANGTSAFTTVATIPQSDVTGLTAALAAKADNAITITGTISLTGGGDLTANRTLSLVNDSTTPGVLKYYGTDSGGTKGFFTLPSPGVGISLITNTGGGLTITNPAGPTTDIDITATGVTAATYGSVNATPQVTVNARGQITAATERPWVVNLVADMVAIPSAQLTNGQVLDVIGYYNVDTSGGGSFRWDSTSTATVDDGSVFQSVSGGVGRWLRNNDNDNVNALWFGVDNTGVAASSSTQAQAAYNYADGASWNKSLYFPAGFYDLQLNLSSQYVSVYGSGGLTTQIRRAATSGAIFTLTDTSGIYSPLEISNISFEGKGTRVDVGLQHTQNGVPNASSGRELVRASRFYNLDIGVNRNYGDFTSWYYDCFFEGNNYNFSSLSTTYANGGDFLIQSGSMINTQLACFYFDGTASASQYGKIVIREVTIQSNPGYVVFAKNMQTYGVPIPTIENCWNENNATWVTAITVGGVTALPTWGYFDNAGHWIIRNTPFSELKLINGSRVSTYDCTLTYAFASTTDATSVLTHSNANWLNYKNIAGFVKSVDDIVSDQTIFGVASWFWTYPLTVEMGAPGATTRLVYNGSVNITYSKFTAGTTTTTASVTDSGIGGLGTCQDLTMSTADDYNSPDTGGTAISSGQYMCFVWVGKLISGTAPTVEIGTTTGYGISLAVPVDNGDFHTLKGMTYLDAPVSYIGLRYVATAACVVREAGWAVVTFTDKTEALQFLNSPIFPA